MCSQQLSLLHWMNNSLISKIYFPQCLFFSKIIHLLKSYISWLDAVRLRYSCKTQIILIEMVQINKTYRHTKHLQITLEEGLEVLSFREMKRKALILPDVSSLSLIQTFNNIVNIIVNALWKSCWKYMSLECSYLPPSLSFEILHPTKCLKEMKSFILNTI